MCTYYLKFTYVEPHVTITSTLVGCGYIYVTWTDTCTTVSYNIASSWRTYTRYGTTRTKLSTYTTQNSQNFTDMPLNTTFNITLFAFKSPKAKVPVSNTVTTSVITPALKSMCVYSYIDSCTYALNYTFN